MKCSACGRAIPADAPKGGCPRCLLALAAEPCSAERVGDYEVLWPISEGGMGRVHVARHVEMDLQVALKRIRPELLQTPGVRALFLQEIRTEASLLHPNITRVYPSGLHEGQPFLVMQLLEGGTLADPENRRRYATPSAALALLRVVTRAVQFAQQRGILHCDLKPANILFDQQGEPHVSDFGLARFLDRAVAGTGAPHGGTPGWMSPEQLERRLSDDSVDGPAEEGTSAPEPLTTQSDVFSLGAILHWLTQGELPYGDGQDFARRVRQERAPLPPSWSPGLGWAAQAICHRALQREPERRYRSAATLADDVERALQRRPLLGYSTPWWGRAWLGMSRHPVLSGAAFTASVVLFALVLAATRMTTTQEQQLRSMALNQNRAAAVAQATAALYQLSRYSDVIERVAHSPPPFDPESLPGWEATGAAGGGAVARTCPAGARLDDASALAPYGAELTAMATARTPTSGHSSLLLYGLDGCPRMRWPQASISADFARTFLGWRDYFRGAQRRCPGEDGERRSKPQRQAYVSHSFASKIDGTIRIALSLPLLDAGRCNGIVAGTLTVGSTLQLAQLDGDGSLTVLLGPFEGDEPPVETDRPRDFTFLVHPRLRPGEKRILDRDMAARLRSAFGSGSDEDPMRPSAAPPLTVEQYRDPFLGGRWLAAFAPVGGTGYIALVQTRDDVAVAPTHALVRRLISGFAWAVLSVLCAFVGFGLWAIRRSLRPATSDGAGARSA